MNNETQLNDTIEATEPAKTSYWRSRAGIYLIVAFLLGGLLLGYEHRAHIFASSWLIYLPLLVCVGMHFFMHGRHGGHGSDGDKS